MHLLRPLTRAAARPSIHEIAASILSPTSVCHARLKSSAPRAACHKVAPPTSAPRHFTNCAPRSQASKASPPQTHDRGPASAETTQTDFGQLDVLGNTPVPTTSIDACLWDGFHLNNGVKITGGSGVLLVAGEAFSWRPWELRGLGANRMLNGKGQWEVGDEAWGVLGLVWPKPDLLIIGVGHSMVPLAPSTRKFINSLGIRVDIQDTRNAAAQFNLLATERGLGNVAAALIPMGWREDTGVKSSS